MVIHSPTKKLNPISERVAMAPSEISNEHPPESATAQPKFGPRFRWRARCGFSQPRLPHAHPVERDHVAGSITISGDPEEHPGARVVSEVSTARREKEYNERRQHDNQRSEKLPCQRP